MGIIQVEKLGKAYRLGEKMQQHGTLRDALVGAVKRPWERWRRMGEVDEEPDAFWALKDVNFEVKKGEVVGIIGRNGAGKSTLLKILSRITEPSEGQVRLRGRVASLLEVGTGFHGELSGRENIFLNGSILGMKRTEIARKFDEIVEFSGVEQFLDTAVKFYSSGMYVRLAFAVAAHLEPEILIVDEVLAVGDSEFQKKCIGKMQQVATGDGRTVLFVSHNMSAVQNLCPRAILMRRGKVVEDGTSEDVVRTYLAGLSDAATNPFENNPERSGDGTARIVGARSLNDRNQQTSHLVAGKAATFEFQYQNIRGKGRATMAITIYNHLGIAVTTFDTGLNGLAVTELGEEGTFACHIPQLPLPIGQYRVTASLQIDGQIADWIPNALVFNVDGSVFFQTHRTPNINHCTCMVEHAWEHEEG